MGRPPIVNTIMTIRKCLHGRRLGAAEEHLYKFERRVTYHGVAYRSLDDQSCWAQSGSVLVLDPFPA